MLGGKSFGLLFSFEHSKDVVSLSSDLRSSAKKFMVSLHLYSFIQTLFMSEYTNSVSLSLAAFKIFLFSLDFSNLIVMHLGVLSLCLQYLGLVIFPKTVS